MEWIERRYSYFLVNDDGQIVAEVRADPSDWTAFDVKTGKKYISTEAAKAAVEKEQHHD